MHYTQYDDALYQWFCARSEENKPVTARLLHAEGQ